jgi:hypothetical protein
VSDGEKRLARLELIEECRQLSFRYARALDVKDLVALDALFTDKCVLEIPGQTYTGRDAIAQFFREALLGDLGTKRHFMMNQTVTATDAVTATMQSYFLYTSAGPAISLIGWGDYDDDVTVEDGIARFTRKRISVERETDVRQGWATE